MNIPKKIISLLTITIMLSGLSLNTANASTKESLVGSGRWETAIQISKNGWENSKEAVLVNDSSIADALSATPFAKAKNAPILLTQSNNLDTRTKAELKRLNVSKVYLIGGNITLSSSLENELKSISIDSERISGDSRYSTSLELAKKIDSINTISKIVVVNGQKGLADAVSVGAAAAQGNMPIILSDTTNGTSTSKDFISKHNITTSYVIGGTNSVSEDVKNSLPNAKRISGENRNQTNAKVIEEFYKGTNLKNLYITKDGMKKQGDLIDSLAVGVLAAKNSSPVLLAGNKLDSVQKDILDTKIFDKITQVGGNGNEDVFKSMQDIQEETKYTVETISELDTAIKKSDANDIIRFKNDDKITGSIDISTKKAITIEFNGLYSGKVNINMPNGDIYNYGDMTGQMDIKDIKADTLVNEGSINEITIYDPNGCKIENEKDADIWKITLLDTSKNTYINNSGTITKIVSDASNTTIKNSGKIDLISGTKSPAVSGNQATDENIKDSDDKEAGGISVYVDSCSPPKEGKVMLRIPKEPRSSSYNIYYRIVKSRPAAMDVGDTISKNSWTKVTTRDSFMISAPDGYYVEAVEIYDSDRKVSKWGRSGSIDDGYNNTTSSATLRSYK